MPRTFAKLGRTPTPEEIGRVLGLPRKKLPIIKKAIRIYNLTPQTDQSEAGWSLGEMVMDDRARSPDEELVESDNLIHVMRQLETMDPDCMKEIGRTMECIDKAGVEMVVRVMPDPGKDIGFNILAIFHYPRHPRIVTCKTMTEAARATNRPPPCIRARIRPLPSHRPNDRPR